MQTIKGTSENLIALFVHALIFQPTLAKASDLTFKVFPQETAYLKKTKQQQQHWKSEHLQRLFKPALQTKRATHNSPFEDVLGNPDR